MKLQELIDTFPPEQEFLIGAASSYFFGGTKAEYEECIDGICREHIHNTEILKTRSRAIKEDARNYIKHRNDGRTVTISFVFERDRIDDPAYANEIRKKLTDIEALQRYYSSIRKYIASTETLDKCNYELSLPKYRNREIESCSKSLLNPDVKLIIIPGTQIGKWWDMDEVKEDKERSEELCRKQDE